MHINTPRFRHSLICLLTLVQLIVVNSLQAGEPKAWNNWRGLNRDGLVESLPDKLTPEPNILWRKKLFSQGLGGVSATAKHVCVVDRDTLDKKDLLHCLDAKDGHELWFYAHTALGNLDYGNSSRATPIILEDRVIFFGAFGHLACLDLKLGSVIWSLELAEKCQLKAKLSWGLCATPLVIDDKLFLYIGGKKIALVGISIKDGEIVVSAAGDPPSYGSLIHTKLGGKAQIIGADHETYGGWDPKTGKRLWTLEPVFSGEFLVPTPLVWNKNLILCGENNGTRMHAFNDNGELTPVPVALNEDLNPDTHSPIIQGNKLLGVSGKLYCLDLEKKLKELWTLEDDAFGEHTSMIASPSQLLIMSANAELLLIDTSAEKPKISSRNKITTKDGEEETGLLSHPALVGEVLYVRLTKEIVALKMGATHSK